jgi:hypothetical protein
MKGWEITKSKNIINASAVKVLVGKETVPVKRIDLLIIFD